VRKTGTRLSLRTDAELRFEKYINPQYSSHAVQMVLDLLAYWKKDLGTYTIQGMSYYTGENYSDQPKSIIVDWDHMSQMIYGDNSLSAETAGSILS
jgi:phenylalanyl-tRNA synthetase beta subunit